ncbi:MAG: hypothetical protein ACKOOI_16185, partial [Pirellula sp.]
MDESFSGVEIELTGKKLQIPLTQIKRISKRPVASLEDPTSAAGTQTEKSVVQRLITDDAVSTGRISSVVEQTPESRTFGWQAKHATDSVPLNPKSDGAIEPVLPQTAGSSPRRARTTEPPVAVVRADGLPVENDFGRALKPEDPSLVLFSVDCFPAVIRRGDSQDFYFESSLFPKQSISQSLVRGLRFVDYRGIEKIDRATRLRLLTLPRVQRSNPPTHLVVSRDGDLLRGKLVLFDRDQLGMDVRGEERTVLVKNIAELIALDPAPKLDETSESSEGSETGESGQSGKESTEETQVAAQADVYQINLEQGARVSIQPVSVDAESLKGIHPQLGECSLPWSS